MKKHGFTLIELLIVVAIIGILAAIAVPNFLNAQLRAQIAKCESEMKMFAEAYTMYTLERGVPPPHCGHPRNQNKYLTTPIPYVSTIPKDPFQKNTTVGLGTLEWSWGEYHADWFGSDGVAAERLLDDQSLYAHALKGRTKADSKTGCHWGNVYYIWSFGPDCIHAPNSIFDIYNASNGLKSCGDIVRVGDA